MSTTIGGSNIDVDVDIDIKAKIDIEFSRHRYCRTVGDGTTTVFAIIHDLDTQDTVESVYSLPSGNEILPPAVTVIHTNENVTTFTFATPPAIESVRIVIQS